MKIGARSISIAVATMSVAVHASPTFAQSPSPSTSASASPSASPSVLPSGTPGNLNTATSPLGEFLVDGNGKSLYVFKNDAMSKSNCSGDCETAWPPLKVQNGAIPYVPTASGDVQDTLLGTLFRDDGLSQVSYNTQPLYYYSGDTQAGQTNGQGLNQFGANWYLVKPDGTALTSSPSPSPSPGPSSSASPSPSPSP